MKYDLSFLLSWLASNEKSCQPFNKNEPGILCPGSFLCLFFLNHTAQKRACDLAESLHEVTAYLLFQDRNIRADRDLMILVYFVINVCICRTIGTNDPANDLRVHTFGAAVPAQV